MRKKIATTMDPTLYEHAKERARREGRPLNELLEHALRQSLIRPGAPGRWSGRPLGR